jgi:O-methyltransferase
MKIIKIIINKLLNAFGYKISKSNQKIELPQLRFENFANLARAYEQILNNKEDLILPNEIRPKLLARLLGTEPSQAYYIIQSLSRCKEIHGDICEFGVAQGETSALIANEIVSHRDKCLHLFDSFEGLPEPTDKDKLKSDIFSLGSIEAYTGTMAYPEDNVKNLLEAISFPNQRYFIHKGFIEQIINNDDGLPRKVSFAFLDFDFYEPTRIALEFLDAVTTKGSIIIVHDYDWFSTGAKTAVDEFIDKKKFVYDIVLPNPRYDAIAILTRIG